MVVYAGKAAAADGGIASLDFRFTKVLLTRSAQRDGVCRERHKHLHNTKGATFQS